MIVLVALNGLRLGFVGGVFSLAGVAAGAYLGAKLAPQVLAAASRRTRRSSRSAVRSCSAPCCRASRRWAGRRSGGPLHIAAAARARLGRRARARRRRRRRDRLGGRRRRAPHAGSDRVARGRAELADPERDQRARAAVASARRDCARRPVRRDPRAAGAASRPRPKLLRDPGVRAARESVMRVTGTACGLGIEGRAGRAAESRRHERARRRGDEGRARRPQRRRLPRRARRLLRSRDDLAVLRVDGLAARPLQLAEPSEGWRSRFSATRRTGRSPRPQGGSARPASCSPSDAYGRGPVRRVVTTLRGRVRHGNSGGPAVDGSGRVRTTIFAARLGSDSGYGVPTTAVRDALGDAGDREVSTGPCVR